MIGRASPGALVRRPFRRRPDGPFGAEASAPIDAVLRGLPDAFVAVHGIDLGAGRIDHLVVGPSGVWVVGVHRRHPVGIEAGRASPPGGREMPAVVAALTRRAEAAVRLVRRAGVDADVHAVIALASAPQRWGPVRVGAVRVLEAGSLVSAITGGSASLPEAEVDVVVRAVLAALRGART